MLLVVDALCNCVDTTINAEPIELSRILYLHLLSCLADIFCPLSSYSEIKASVPGASSKLGDCGVSDWVRDLSPWASSAIVAAK